MQFRQEKAEKKFIACDGDDCGYIKYRQTDDTLEVLSTFVPPELRGGGRAAEMTRFALNYAREQGLRVDPICTYTQLFLKRNKAEYADLFGGTSTSSA